MFHSYYEQKASSPEELYNFAPEGWKQNSYLIDKSEISIERRVLKIIPEIFIHETKINSGHVRLDAQFDSGMLQIGFYNSKDYKTQGIDATTLGPELCIISYDRSHWEAVTKSPASGITLNFHTKYTKKIIDPDLHQKIKEISYNGKYHSGIVIQKEQINGELFGILHELLGLGINMKYLNIESLKSWSSINQVIDELIEQSISFLESSTLLGGLTPGLGPRQRHSLVRQIEDILNIYPTKSDTVVTLDYLSKTLGASRRNIQLAINEKFGVGFLELKRIIRLNQFRKELVRNENCQIHDLAMDYEFFHFGRFAQYYRDYFGENPSKTASMFRNR